MPAISSNSLPGMRIVHPGLFLLLISLIVILIACNKDDDNPIQDSCESSAVFNPEKQYGVMFDQEGNVYKTIQIGSQTWMAENLRTKSFRNGDPIGEEPDVLKWKDLTIPAYCNYNNTEDPDTICTYGRLYNWNTVNDDREIAPEGWHVPSLEEWRLLEVFLVDSTAGINLKEAGTVHWSNSLPERIGTNVSGFTALPGGYRWAEMNKGDKNMGIEGGWWTTTEEPENNENVFHVTIGYNYPMLGGCFCSKLDGYSIRCIQD